MRKNIKISTADVSRLQCCNQRIFIYYIASGYINKV